MSLKDQLLDDIDDIYLKPEMLMRLLDKLSTMEYCKNEHFKHLIDYQKRLDIFKENYFKNLLNEYLIENNYEINPMEGEPLIGEFVTVAYEKNNEIRVFSGIWSKIGAGNMFFTIDNKLSIKRRYGEWSLTLNHARCQIFRKKSN